MSKENTAGRKERFLFQALPPLTLYVHIPWCQKKCPYCDFNSHPVRGALPERAYVDAVLTDLDQDLPQVWGRRLRSVFIGGGTPSLLSPRSIAHLISGIRARLVAVPEMEITLEANPGSSEASKFREFRNAGVNRLSVGVQSFNDASLTRIGRVHNAAAATKAVEAVIDAGFDNFNLDLMHSLPGQNPAMAIDDIQTAVAFNPPHLSCYQLTIEPNTMFHRQPPTLPGDDESWEIQSAVQSILGKAGYQQYEISAYAKQNILCQHNLNYWQFGDYLGVGAGAHSKVTFAERVTRSWKVKHPVEYLRKASSDARIGGLEDLSAAEVRFQFMLNALRLRQPTSAALFQQRTGQTIFRLKTELEQAQEEGLLIFDGNTLTTTPLGYRFLDDLLQRFLPQPGHKA